MLKVESKPKCPRSGYVVLTSNIGNTYVMDTSCKTWGCQVCRKKVLSYVKLRMEYGSLSLTPFYLITVTLQEDSEHAKGAQAVRAIWEPFIRFLKLKSPNLTWFKIVELTKQGIPHLHLIVGGLGSRVASCRRKGEFRHSLIETHRSCKVDCLIHEWGKAWYAVTGDSFVVDARKGYSPARLANYLGKYLVKSFYHREALIEMGFIRRWSCARNWPSPEKLVTKTQTKGGWAKVEIVKGYGMRDYLRKRVDEDRKKEAIQQVGEDLVLKLTRGKRKSAALVDVERMMKSGN